MISIYSFKIVEEDTPSYKYFLDLNAKSNLFTQLSWLKFINDHKKTKTIIIEAFNNKTKVFFVAQTFKKLGFTFVGSPFSGWSTPYMGVVGDLEDCYEFYKGLIKFLRKKFHPLLIEIIDKNITENDAKRFRNRKLSTLILDLSLSEDELFKNFKQDARNFIRQFERKGSKIEIATDYNIFAKEYYNQLMDVFKKQNMIPTYNENKVLSLLSSLKGTNNLLCLRVINPDGICIATSIFIGYNDTFYFWGGASYRDYQYYRPNEAMIWFAIKYWKNLNMKKFDMMGVRKYKEKFGPNEVNMFRIYGSSFPFAVLMRNFVEKKYYKNLER